MIPENFNVSEYSLEALLKIESTLKEKIRRAKNKNTKAMQIELCYIQNEIHSRKGKYFKRKQYSK
jgi:hypothetical protein